MHMDEWWEACKHISIAVCSTNHEYVIHWESKFMYESIVEMKKWIMTTNFSARPLEPYQRLFRQWPYRRYSLNSNPSPSPLPSWMYMYHLNHQGAVTTGLNRSHRWSRRGNCPFFFISLPGFQNMMNKNEYTYTSNGFFPTNTSMASNHILKTTGVKIC